MRVIGIMSGTSLDGLDIASCIFPEKEPENFKIEQADTIEYPAWLSDKLKFVMKGTAEDLASLDYNLGYFIGEQVKEFINRTNLSPDLIASHGHTVFHQPANGFTCQIGNGSCIASRTGIPVVYDFRALDVALGGQGAPLVPVGDRILFGAYDFCLNIGGIANISYAKGNTTFAFDVCPANMALNNLANEKGLQYDTGGALASSGRVNSGLLEKLNSLDFYRLSFPKSLGKEWYDRSFFPLITDTAIPLEDRLNTVCQHIAHQIGHVVKQERTSKAGQKILITGGGAFNKYLVRMLEEELTDDAQVVVPEDTIVKFKEALIFAWLGYLRVKNKPNVLATVTGARFDNVGGVLTFGHV